MKKLFISIVAAMFTMFATAADDSAVIRLTLTGATSGGSCQVILIENAAYSAGFDNGYDALCNINLSEALPKTLYMYSFIGSKPYSTIATNNLDNLVLGFTSNLIDEEYSLSFEVFTLAAERTLTLYDRAEKVSKEIKNGEKYNFSIDASQVGHVGINNRFFINPQPAHFDIIFAGKDDEVLDRDEVALFVPVAPEIEGFTFQGWDVVAGHLEDGIVLQAIYTSDEPTSAPEVVVNPANPSQKLVRNGQVYILRDNATYTLQGQMVK